MANNYSESTGLLRLKKVTPVIEAMFGQFNFGPTHSGEFYIGIDDETCPLWEGLSERLSDLCNSLGIKIGLDDMQDTLVEKYLGALADHFGKSDDTDLMNYIEHIDVFSTVEIDEMYFLATKFDDGHGLSAMEIEGCWYCSKLRYGEQGGWGSYDGKYFSDRTHSNESITYGRAIDVALGFNDVETATKIIAKRTESMLSGISDENQRKAVLQRLNVLMVS